MLHLFNWYIPVFITSCLLTPSPPIMRWFIYSTTSCNCDLWTHLQYDMNMPSLLGHVTIRHATERILNSRCQYEIKSTPSLGLKSMQILCTIYFFAQLYEYFKAHLILCFSTRFFALYNKLTIVSDSFNYNKMTIIPNFLRWTYTNVVNTISGILLPSRIITLWCHHCNLIYTSPFECNPLCPSHICTGYDTAVVTPCYNYLSASLAPK